jgi:hypothetical protein
LEVDVFDWLDREVLLSVNAFTAALDGLIVLMVGWYLIAGVRRRRSKRVLFSVARKPSYYAAVCFIWIGTQWCIAAWSPILGQPILNILIVSRFFLALWALFTIALLRLSIVPYDMEDDIVSLGHAASPYTDFESGA